MKKEVSIITFLLSLFVIDFVSAQLFGGGYGNYGYGGYGFSLTDIFSRIDPQEMILVSFFVILLLFISTGLKKVGLFRDVYGNPQTGVIVIISLVISLAATYGIYQSGQVYQIEDFLTNSGVSPLWILAVLLSLLVIIKLGFPALLISAGVLIALVTLFTDAFYEKTLPLLGGIAAFLIGLWLRKRSGQQRNQTHVHLHGGGRRRRRFSSV